jgi:hypothetical protein
MVSPEPGWGLPVKSRKMDQKSIFVWKMFEEQKNF